MGIPLSRNKITQADFSKSSNPGLWLRRGMQEWPTESGSDGAGGVKARKIAEIAALRPDPGYHWAYARWCAATQGAARFDARELALVGRLYIGVVRDNPLEAGVTVAHAWGMPLIPGSAIKGVSRDAARAAGLEQAALTHLFGSEDDANPESGIAVFHDAWWVPDKSTKPFVADIVTPHHTDYYAEGKAHATDFDSPIPAAQIAVQGAFRFVVEGPDGWRELAMGMLTRALTGAGIGGKTTSGYGLFQDPAE